MITILTLILIVAGVFGWGRFLGWLVNRADRIDSAPPEAAESPDADGDFIAARAQPFTGEEPVIVAGDDLLWADKREKAKVYEQFAGIAAELEDLNDCDRLAAYYLRPEVSQ
jgi:hypothetical protein